MTPGGMSAALKKPCSFFFSVGVRPEGTDLLPPRFFFHFSMVLCLTPFQIASFSSLDSGAFYCSGSGTHNLPHLYPTMYYRFTNPRIQGTLDSPRICFGLYG